MPLFWKPHTSDVTNLIKELRAKKPTLEAEQSAGMALQWVKKVDARTQAEFKKAKVAQQAYVYQTKAH
jgi:hypothetical protein